MGNGSKCTNTWIFMQEGRNFTPEKIDELVKKDKRGYLLEVDLEYRKELHENQILGIKKDLQYRSKH